MRFSQDTHTDCESQRRIYPAAGAAQLAQPPSTRAGPHATIKTNARVPQYRFRRFRSLIPLPPPRLFIFNARPLHVFCNCAFLTTTIHTPNGPRPLLMRRPLAKSTLRIKFRSLFVNRTAEGLFCLILGLTLRLFYKILIVLIKLDRL